MSKATDNAINLKQSEFKLKTPPEYKQLVNTPFFIIFLGIE